LAYVRSLTALFFGTGMVRKGTGRTRNIQSSSTAHGATTAGKEAGSAALHEGVRAGWPYSMGVRSSLVGTVISLRTIVNARRHTAELSAEPKQFV
jgi:hypothetical protein